MTARVLHCPAADLVAAVARVPAEARARLAIVDAPWSYGGATVPGHGASDHYGGIPVPNIVNGLIALREACLPDAWLITWVTLPVQFEFFREILAARPLGSTWPWEYVTGGVWGKRGRVGVGRRVRGDAELWLVFRVGNPPTHALDSNFEGTDLDETARKGHSQKPHETTLRQVRTFAGPDELVLDPYAGEFGTVGKACIQAGRRYLGAEIDHDRHRRCATNLQQAETVWGIVRETRHA